MAGTRAHGHRGPGAVRHVIERGISRGQVRSDVDVRSAATMVAAPLGYRLVVERETPTEALVDDVVDLVVRAVAPRA
jgi:hypothetical protein